MAQGSVSPWVQWNASSCKMQMQNICLILNGTLVIISSYYPTLNSFKGRTDRHWRSLRYSVFWLCLLMIWLNWSDLISPKANNGLLQPWLQHDDDDDDDGDEVICSTLSFVSFYLSVVYPVFFIVCLSVSVCLALLFLSSMGRAVWNKWLIDWLIDTQNTVVWPRCKYRCPLHCNFSQPHSRTGMIFQLYGRVKNPIGSW